MNLRVICDGGVHTAEYLWQNNIHPKEFFFDAYKFSQKIPYFNKDNDYIALVVHGFITIPKSEIYDLIDSIEESDTIKKFIIFTDVPLNIDKEYVLYQGDLIKGKKQLVQGVKKGNLITKDLTVDVWGNLRKIAQCSVDECIININNTNDMAVETDKKDDKDHLVYVNLFN